MPTVLERIEADGPKRILACDGGGILGLMSVEILAKIEADLRAKTGKPTSLLAGLVRLRLRHQHRRASSPPASRSACRRRRSATST
jgi:hypothetical protein